MKTETKCFKVSDRIKSEKLYNGNMLTDRNKGITYNFLNLPELIMMGTGKSISYTYNAAGQKVKKFVVDETTTPETQKEVDYLDGFQYAGQILQFFGHSEGYVSATPTAASLGSPPTSYAYNYVFNYTDHLGNVRLSYTKDPATSLLKVLEENHYYPFGLKHSVYNTGKMDFEKETEQGIPPVLNYVTKTKYDYKYNGKEFQDELGLGFYDYGARNYDPTLGRWMNIDPLAEMYYSYSTYNYAANNPVVFIDPDGMNLDWYQEEGGDYVYDSELTADNASERLGEGDKYLGESASVGVNNSSGETVGTLNLNTDGSASYTQGGQSISFNDATFNLGFESGNQVKAGNHQTGNSFDFSYTMNQIGNVSMALEGITSLYDQYGKYGSSKGLRLVGSAAGHLGSLASAGVEINSYHNKEISGLRATYNLTGIGTSAFAGGYIGAQTSGLYGFIAGSLIGATFSSAQMAYDVVAPQIISDFNGDINTIKSNAMP